MRTTVVIATRNRCRELFRTLTNLRGLKQPIIVLDNASEDDTRSMVRREFPDVRLVTLPRNAGAAARNRGVELADTPYVAFSDDDSWWAPGSLTRAEHLLDEHPRVGLLAALPLVGPDERADPVSALMSDSPLGKDPGLPGPSVLGFLACSAIVRREAYLRAGGFSPLLHFAAEEKLLSYDLAAHGWALCYVEEIRAHHHPSPNRSATRPLLEARNNLLISWLRRPLTVAIRHTKTIARQALRDSTARRAFSAALRRLPAALTQRRRLPDAVERQIRLLEEN